MLLKLRVALLACIISAIDLAAGIAPGDEEPLCQQLRDAGTAVVPNYTPNMTVLMDSWNYQNLLPERTGAVWEQVDNDTNNPDQFTTNWIQQSNTPCGQTVQVCGFAAGAQNNWLITQLISRTVSEGLLSEVSVLIEFEQRDCDVTLNCQRTFNTHIFETPTEDAVGRKDIRNYRQVDRVSPDTTDGSGVNVTFAMPFQTDHPSFYFAVQDEASCIVLTRLLIFYHICPSQIVDLVSYPEIIAPMMGTAPIPITAQCASNAEAESDNDRNLICSAGGIWTALGSGCRCEPRSVFLNGACSICPVGTYASPNSRSCSSCPDQSVSNSPGLVQCDCFSGYYRAVTGEEDLPCVLPPSPPLNVRIVSSTDDTIFVSWDAPQFDGGRGGLIYGLYYQLDCDGCERVKYGVLNETSGVIKGLLPQRTYVIFVSSENDITNQVSDNGFSTIATSVQVSTLAIPGSFSSTDVTVAAIVPSLVALFLLLILITVIIVLNFVCKQLSYKERFNNSAENRAYYSTVGPPLPVSLKSEENVTYEVVHSEPAKSSDLSDVKKNVAYGVLIH